jgi:hypothetical protein
MAEGGNREICDDLYQTVVDGFGGDNYILFDLAQCFISGFDKEKLRTMLKSHDDCLVLDGLFIAGEIGDLVKEYIPELRVLCLSSDKEISGRAEKLLELYG